MYRFRQTPESMKVERHIKKFEEEPELEILNGRYGPYITYKVPIIKSQRYCPTGF